MTHPILARLSLVKKCLLSIAGLVAIAGPLAAGLRGGVSVAQAGETNAVEMTRYKSSEWKYELDVPSEWHKLPPVPTEGRSEIMRFASVETGAGLIVLRGTYDAKQHSPKRFVDETRQSLTRGRSSNFVPGEATIGSRRALTLNYTEATRNGGALNCRHYFIFDGPLWYMLRFCTPHGEDTFELFDRMAKSFAFENL